MNRTLLGPLGSLAAMRVELTKLARLEAVGVLPGPWEFTVRLDA